MSEHDWSGFELSDYVELAHDMAKEKGWYSNWAGRNIPEALALIHSEVSEALECYRNNEMGEYYRPEAPNKPEGLAFELADVLIRVFDLCGYLKIDLERAIQKKMEYNGTRPYRHGGKKA